MNRSITAALLTITLTLGSSGVAVAGEAADLIRKVYLEYELSETHTLTNKSERVDLAKGIHKFCLKYSQAIPRLSPRESDWLESEIRSGRAINASQTTEYYKRVTSIISDNCLSLSVELQKSIPVKNEMHLWATLASKIKSNDFKLYLTELIDKKEITLLDKDDLLASGLMRGISDLINEKVIMLYLKP